jgi:single-strand DNA-binding protein
MKDLNKIMLIGRLGKDPTMISTKTGVSMTQFSLATSRKFRDSKSEDGVLREETVWHQVVVFGKTAEHCQQYLKKGSRAFIEGNLKTRKFEKDGKERYISEIHADDVSFLDFAKGPRQEIGVEAAVESVPA